MNGPTGSATTRIRKPATTTASSPATVVQLARTKYAATTHQALWTAIRCSTEAISWKKYQPFIDDIMCRHASVSRLSSREDPDGLRDRRALPFPGVDSYELLKVATEIFLMTHCGVDTNFTITPGRPSSATLQFADTIDPIEEAERLGANYTIAQLVRRWRAYTDTATGSAEDTIPYYALIRLKLKDVPVRQGEQRIARNCYGILQEKLTRPCFLELIWSYWHEEGMLAQSMNAISMRFQNRKSAPGRDPLGELEIDPLRGLNNLLWGYIQDEQHRLTVARRAYEYDHHYGISLHGKAVPALHAADTRSKFLEAFHRLLHLCLVFYKEDDDTTVIADGFPILNALKELHLVLTQGQHNQYGDLPWNSRLEFLQQEWILARPEMRDFLPGRVMVAYPEGWMDRVDGMKKLQSWTDTSVLHFRDLGIFGEQVLLSVRFAPWNEVNDRTEASNWARYWRAEIQGYVHAYQAVTGADLGMDRVDATPPSVHLRNRLVAQGHKP